MVLEVGAGLLGEATVDMAFLAALSLVPRALQSGCAFRYLAVFSHRRDAGEPLHALGGGEALPVVAEGGEQPG